MDAVLLGMRWVSTFADRSLAKAAIDALETCYPRSRDEMFRSWQRTVSQSLGSKVGAGALAE
jgi:hypothetical protein